MTTQPSLHKSFESALLFFTGEGEQRMLLQVCSDFDVTKRQLDDLFGKGRKLMSPFESNSDEFHDKARYWNIDSEARFDEAFKRFFRPFKAPDEVRNKPVINKLVLLPCMLDVPFVPNDLGDKG